MKNIFILLLSLLVVGFIFTLVGEQNRSAVPLPSKLENAALPGNVIPSATPGPTNLIRIVEPHENSHLPALSTTFVCGSVPATGKLLINGTPVPVHSGGGFLTMVHLTPGKFLDQSGTASR